PASPSAPRLRRPPPPSGLGGGNPQPGAYKLPPPPRSLRMRPVKSSLSRLLVIPGILLAAAALASEGAVDPRIFAGKAAEESASFLVVMREQADLSGADALRGKAPKASSASHPLAPPPPPSPPPPL